MMKPAFMAGFSCSLTALANVCPCACQSRKACIYILGAPKGSLMHKALNPKRLSLRKAVEYTLFGQRSGRRCSALLKATLLKFLTQFQGQKILVPCDVSGLIFITSICVPATGFRTE